MAQAEEQRRVTATSVNSNARPGPEALGEGRIDRVRATPSFPSGLIQAKSQFSQ